MFYTVFEGFAVFAYSFELKAPALGFDPLGHVQSNKQAKDLLCGYIAPIGMGGCALISLLALVFGETKSKVVWIWLAYHHLVISLQLVVAISKQQDHPMVLLKDILPALGWHAAVSDWTSSPKLAKN